MISKLPISLGDLISQATSYTTINSDFGDTVRHVLITSNFCFSTDTVVSGSVEMERIRLTC